MTWGAVIFAASVVAGDLNPALSQTGQASVVQPAGDDALKKAREAFRRKDYASTLNWLRKSADQNNAEAQASLGMMYYEGLGVTQDFAQSFSWYLKAATQDHTNAQDVVGHMYLWGKGVTQDYALALTWLRKAADKGSKNALMAIGGMYVAGEGVPQDLKTGLMWMEKAVGDKRTPGQTSSFKPDITLRCELAALNGKRFKTLVSIDTKSKYIKFEVPGQEAFEYRDGAYGKVITGGPFAGKALNVHQFVSIEDNYIRFGTKENEVVDEYTLDRRSGLLRLAGQVTECTLLPSKPQF